MITRLNMKSVASYKSDGAELSGLKKINFVYGANGTGKTTISNFLLDQANPKYKHCQISWDGGTPLGLNIYNKTFRDENFVKGNIPGVFTLGKATQEELEEIEKNKDEEKLLLKQIRDKTDLRDKHIQKAKEIEIQLDETAWGFKKKYEAIFNEAFTGSVGSKSKFSKRLIDEINKKPTTSTSIEELRYRSNTIFRETPEKADLINLPNFDEIVALLNNDLWKTKIIGKSDVDIAGLISELNISDWVNQGRSYIQDDICPFCQQSTITDIFKLKLDDYFDKTYIDNLKKLEEYKERLLAASTKSIQSLRLLEANARNNKSKFLDFEILSILVNSLETKLNNISLRVTDKINEASRSITLPDIDTETKDILEVIKAANVEIKQHNNIVDNFQTEKIKLTKEIWEFIALESKPLIEPIQRQLDGRKTAQSSISIEITDFEANLIKIKEKIVGLENKSTSIQPSINAINKVLKSYGFLDFEIVESEKDGFYQIMRDNGEVSHDTLSEGEVTFITFLYFYQLCRGSIDPTSVSKTRVLIIDDPISSLDSNVLFVVSTLIKSILNDVRTDKGNIRQVILMTHNIYFHKEVSFIDGRTKEQRDTAYWIVRKENTKSSIKSYGIKNPILSSYELLWRELEEENISCITAQNTMRRILENYFKINGKYGDDTLIASFDNKDEQEICRSLLSWVNDGSHCISDDLFVEMPDTTHDKFKKVFKAIFIKTKNEGHYNMMTRGTCEVVLD